MDPLRPHSPALYLVPSTFEKGTYFQDLDRFPSGHLGRLGTGPGVTPVHSRRRSKRPSPLNLPVLTFTRPVQVRRGGRPSSTSFRQLDGSDSCCINKESSAELSEAVNSMYNWYREAKTCYAYLRDTHRIDGIAGLKTSVWFGRGWTLQELVAPRRLSFYDQHWQPMGTKRKMADEIAQQTKIDVQILKGETKLREYNVAQKMTWAAGRQTTRIEDQAYCLMGLFDVNMPLLYGEGNKAFIRLQEEIIRKDDDHTIFAWELTFQSGGPAGSDSLAVSQRRGSARLFERRSAFPDDKQRPLDKAGITTMEPRSLHCLAELQAEGLKQENGDLFASLSRRGSVR